MPALSAKKTSAHAPAKPARVPGVNRFGQRHLPKSKDRALVGKGVLTVETAKSLLLAYQRRWVESKARFLCGRWSRQTGKSFSTAYIIAEDMVANPNREWMIAAPSARQSLNALQKVKQWLRVLGVFYSAEISYLKSENISEKSEEVKLANGSRVFCVPGRPDTVRGYSCSVWMDEFAFFEDPEATWMAILPSITNSLSGGEKRVIITSTPNGKAGRGQRFYDICEGRANGDDMEWECVHLPLQAAIDEGLPVNYKTLAAALGNPQAVLQELDAEFTDSATQLIPYDIILRSESESASAHALADLYSGQADLRIGVDVGHISDPTVVWVAEKLGDVLYTREVVVLKDMGMIEQLEVIRPRVAAATRCCLDATGLGVGWADSLVAEFGLYDPENHGFGIVEPCPFTQTFKCKIFPDLLTAMEAQRLRLPMGDSSIRSDFAAMEQVVTANGGYSYEAPRTKNGHSDRCTAAALCVRAGKGAGGTTRPNRWQNQAGAARNAPPQQSTPHRRAGGGMRPRSFSAATTTPKRFRNRFR